MLSSDDQDLARRDPALPGLATILDPAALGGWLCATAGTTQTAAPLRTEPLYVRYKPGTSCMVLVRVLSPAASTLVTVTCYRADAADKLAKARAFASEHPSTESWIDDHLAITAHAFPADRALPALARLHDDTARPRMLRKMFADAAGTAHAEFLLRYKPHRRWVSAWNITGQRVVLKAYAEGEYDRALANAFGAAAVAPPPLASSDRHRLIAWAWLDGAPCTHAEATEAAAAIARLHRSNVSFNHQTDARAIATWATDAADAIRDLAPDQGPLAHATAAAIQQRMLPFTHPAPLHGDCSLDQCIHTASGVRLIDFDNALMGPPELDLGNFVAKCVLASGDHGVADALLSAYARESRHDPRTHIGPLMALGFLRAATDAFRRRVPDWAAHARSALDHAHEVLRAR